MTPEQDAAVKAHINKHFKGGCPICQSTAFFLNPHVSMVPQIGQAVIQSGQPVITVSCQTCGYAMFFNVFYMGLGELFGLKTTEELERERAQAKEKVNAK